MAKRILFTRRTLAFAGIASVAGGTIGSLAQCSDKNQEGQPAAKSQPSQPTASTVPTNRLQTIISSGVVHAGYGGFRPYTIANASNPSQPTGFLVDVFKEIVRRMSPAPRIEWVPITFDSLRADMDSGRVDVLVDAVYETIPRAQDFLFTAPFGYFGVGVAVVRNDSKFNSLADIDHDGVVVALAEGWTSTDFAKDYFKHAKLSIVPVGDDGFVPLNEVLAGRADAALQDVPTAAQFLEAHKDSVRAIGLDSPPARVAAAFLLRRGSEDLRDFLNVAFEVLRADGSLARIASQWKLYNQFPERSFSSSPGD